MLEAYNKNGKMYSMLSLMLVFIWFVTWGMCRREFCKDWMKGAQCDKGNGPFFYSVPHLIRRSRLKERRDLN